MQDLSFKVELKKKSKLEFKFEIETSLKLNRQWGIGPTEINKIECSIAQALKWC